MEILFLLVASVAVPSVAVLGRQNIVIIIVIFVVVLLVLVLAGHGLFAEVVVAVVVDVVDLLEVVLGKAGGR